MTGLLSAVFTSACMFSPFSINMELFIFVSFLPIISKLYYTSAHIIPQQHPSISSVAVAAGRLGVVLLPPRPSRQPGGDRVRGGLLGHAVMADHCVEAAPGVGVLSGVVRLQRGRDTPLVLQGRARKTRMTK